MDADLRDLIALNKFPGLESSAEKSRLSLLLHASSFVELTACLNVARAAESASLASASCKSEELGEDERALTSFEHWRSLDLADLVSVFCLGLVFNSEPRLTVLLLAEAAADRTELVDWRRMETDEGESALHQFSLNLWRLSASNVLYRGIFSLSHLTLILSLIIFLAVIFSEVFSLDRG